MHSFFSGMFCGRKTTLLLIHPKVSYSVKTKMYFYYSDTTTYKIRFFQQNLFFPSAMVLVNTQHFKKLNCFCQEIVIFSFKKNDRPDGSKMQMPSKLHVFVFELRYLRRHQLDVFHHKLSLQLLWGGICQKRKQQFLSVHLHSDTSKKPKRL